MLRGEVMIPATVLLWNAFGLMLRRLTEDQPGMVSPRISINHVLKHYNHEDEDLPRATSDAAGRCSTALDLAMSG